MKTLSKFLKLIFLIGFCSIQNTNLFAQTKLYVDSSAAPGGDGSSWAMALTSPRTSEMAADVGYGGGMFNGTNSNVFLINCYITNNSALWAGGMYNYVSSPTLINCVISGNTATQYGGGILNYSQSTSKLINVTIAANKSGTSGGGIFNLNDGNAIISNSIIYYNSSGIQNTNTTPVISYSLVQGSADVTNGNIDGNTNPIFAAPLSYMSAPTADGDFRLQITSPLINKGKNDNIPAGITSDLDNHPRISQSIVDMGAYEFGTVCPGFHVLYVDSSVNKIGDGSSWGNAMPSLAAAVKLAQDCTGIDSILIAKGTYYPEYKPPVDTPLTNRDKSFYFFRDGLALIGGYPNGGGARSVKANPVILNGDIGTPGTNTDNAFHVLLIVGGGSANPIDSTLSFDGITISGGNADNRSVISVNGNDIARVWGGGVYDINYSSPAFRNCIITGNKVAEDGANAGYGGGMNNEKQSNPFLINCYVTNNRAFWGGGIINNSSSPTLLNCAITGNNATQYGGGILDLGQSMPRLINNTIAANNAFSAGAIFNLNNASAVISNSVIYGNSSGIINTNTTPVITYSLVQGNADITHGNIDGNTDPLFSAPESFMNAPTTAGDYRLQNFSPVINKGNNDSIPTGFTTDLDENPRILQSIVDMGAYEYGGGVLPLKLLSFEAKTDENCKVSIDWHTANEQNLANFILEQSSDAKHFKSIAFQMPTNNGAGKWYQAKVSMDGAVDYYRLKILDEDGNYTYSKTISVSSKCVASDIQIFPNPVQGTMFVKNYSQGMLYLIMDTKGKTLMKGTLRNSIPLSRLSSGVYLMKFFTEKGLAVETTKFIKL